MPSSNAAGKPPIGGAPPQKRGRGRPKGSGLKGRVSVVWRLDADVLARVRALCREGKGCFANDLNALLRERLGKGE